MPDKPHNAIQKDVEARWTEMHPTKPPFFGSSRAHAQLRHGLGQVLRPTALPQNLVLSVCAVLGFKEAETWARVVRAAPLTPKTTRLFWQFGPLVADSQPNIRRPVSRRKAHSASNSSIPQARESVGVGLDQPIDWPDPKWDANARSKIYSAPRRAPLGQHRAAGMTVHSKPHAPCRACGALAFALTAG
jgi:hypothetical protein